MLSFIIYAIFWRKKKLIKFSGYIFLKKSFHIRVSATRVISNFTCYFYMFNNQIRGKEGKNGPLFSTFIFTQSFLIFTRLNLIKHQSKTECSFKPDKKRLKWFVKFSKCNSTPSMSKTAINWWEQTRTKTTINLSGTPNYH